MMVGESNKNIFFIQIDASSFAEFEISEFEILRFDCIENVFEICHFSIYFFSVVGEETGRNIAAVLQPVSYCRGPAETA